MQGCPRLWNEIFIDKDASVYACCHSKPACLGNLYDASLQEIVNNRVAERFREESLAGKLECFSYCTLLSRKELEKASHYSDSVAHYEDLKRLKILFSEFCNIDCIMCWQDHRDKEVLDAELLIKQVDLSPFEVIDLQGGEPLAIPAATRYFHHVAQAGKKMTLLTNGLLINPSWAEKISQACKRVQFSINASNKVLHEKINRGSSWERVINSVSLLKEYKERTNSQILIAGHMTIVEENLGDIPDFLTSMGEFFEELSFCYDTNVISTLGSNLERFESLAKKVTLAFEEMELTVCDYGVERLRELGLLR